MKEKDFDKIAFDFYASRKRLIILNYEGCLVPRETRPAAAAPNLQVSSLLKRLTDDDRNQVLVISEFDRKTLSKILSNQKLILVAGKGTHYREPGCDWKRVPGGLHNEWMTEALSACRALAFGYEGSYVSIEKNAISWNYKAIAHHLSEIEITQISTAIRNLRGSAYFKITNGNHLIELRATGVAKSLLLADTLVTTDHDLVIIMGDGDTHENNFSGPNVDCSANGSENGSPQANFILESQDEALTFLRKLIEANRAFNKPMPFFNFSSYELN